MMATQRRALAPAAAPGVSHNLLGQRLGRKGQETRERILAAALRLFEGPGEGPITLTALSREAAVGMPTLYVYFPDLGDLVLEALKRVMASAETAFVDRLRQRWPDAALAARALDFLRAHLGFWQRHARILHMRNSLADGGDARFLAYRNLVSRPLIDLLVRQMDHAPGAADADNHPWGTVLLAGFERIATVVTNPVFHRIAADGVLGDEAAYVDTLLRTEAELMALAIAGRRAGRETKQ